MDTGKEKQKSKALAVYLDVCCLNRPLDDQTQGRVLLEADATILIVQGIEEGRWDLLTSEAIDFEVSRTNDLFRRERIEGILIQASSRVIVNDEIENRASALVRLGFRALDALHIACAEFAHADIFLTTDDKLLKRARQIANDLTVRVENPTIWYTEVSADD